ncbi:MAG: thioredoxin [Chloroflexi bacterium]|nr:MAG: thioredoxin [Chloroflexota bacterium]TMD55460.1 MAG: thioredoxin [Chloroflexota bacterium]
MSHVNAVTDADFESQVLKSEEPVLVDFWAAWCGPCRMIAPIVEDLAGEFGAKAKVLKMDVDANPQTPMKFGIMSIPTVIVFKGGQAVERQVGYRPTLKSILQEKLSALV